MSISTSRTARGAAAGAVALALLVTPSAPASAHDGHGRTVTAHAQADGAGFALEAGRLTDLQKGKSPLDRAHAVVLSLPTEHGSVVLLSLRDVRRAAGQRFGAHVHEGPCLKKDPAAALGHYAVGAPASATTEVWLDVTISKRGTGISVASVPFRVAPGERSVVLHEKPTDPTGAAGTRLACLPVTFT